MLLLVRNSKIRTPGVVDSLRRRFNCEEISTCGSRARMKINTASAQCILCERSSVVQTGRSNWQKPVQAAYRIPYSALSTRASSEQALPSNEPSSKRNSAQTKY